MPDFTIAYNSCPNHDPALCNQCAEEAYIQRPRNFEITFNAPSGIHHSRLTFKNAGDLIEYVSRWETDPPMFGWTIQAIEQMADNFRRPRVSNIRIIGLT